MVFVERRGNRGERRESERPGFRPLDVLIIGAGVFGTTGALALARRGHRVRLVDPGPLPHPLAASTDQSKVVRPDYGDDALYTALGVEALEGWRRWNARFGERHGRLYHPVGFMLRARDPLDPGGFEARSFAALGARVWPVEWIGADVLARRFPQWKAANYPHGYLNHGAGWADAERTMKALLGAAGASRRVKVMTDLAAIELIEEGGRIAGLYSAEGERHRADVTVVATGSWIPTLVPDLSPVMRATGHPILVFRAPEPDRWRPPRFVAWAADIARSGWYGFPARGDGTIKIARHAAGVRLPAGAPRVVDEATVDEARAFLAETFPALADAPLVTTRLCAYCDTADGHFWIDRHPDWPGLVVAGGGSGHAFKFAPILGERIVAAVEGRSDDIEPRFRWRVPASGGREAARAR